MNSSQVGSNFIPGFLRYESEAYQRETLRQRCAHLTVGSAIIPQLEIESRNQTFGIVNHNPANVFITPEVRQSMITTRQVHDEDFPHHQASIAFRNLLRVMTTGESPTSQFLARSAWPLNNPTRRRELNLSNPMCISQLSDMLGVCVELIRRCDPDQKPMDPRLHGILELEMDRSYQPPDLVNHLYNPNTWYAQEKSSKPPLDLSWKDEPLAIPLLRTKKYQEHVYSRYPRYDHDSNRRGCIFHFNPHLPRRKSRPRSIQYSLKRRRSTGSPEEEPPKEETSSPEPESDHTVHHYSSAFPSQSDGYPIHQMPNPAFIATSNSEVHQYVTPTSTLFPGYESNPPPSVTIMTPYPVRTEPPQPMESSAIFPPPPNLMIPEMNPNIAHPNFPENIDDEFTVLLQNLSQSENYFSH